MAKRVLTDVAIKRIKPPASGQIEVFDRGYPGLALRIGYGGNKSFVVFLRVAGRLRRVTLGAYPAMSLAEAREEWRTAREAAMKGIDPSLARKREKPATSFAAVAEEWLKRDQSKNRSEPWVRRLIERDVLPYWQHRQITEIGRRDVLDVIDAVADRGTVVTARRLLSHLHRLFRWSIGRGIIESNPAADLPKPGVETKRDRVLSDGELVAVWRGAGQLGWPFGSAIRLLLLTGTRRDEVADLKWSEIDGTTINLTGGRTKSARSHDVALSAPAVQLLSEAPRVAGSEFVFTTNGKTPISGWSRAKHRLDQLALIDPWRIHDLRRTVATGLQKLGVGLQVIEEVLGHVSGSRSGVVGTYQRHSFDAEKRTALEAWGAHVTALIGGREAGKVLPFGSRA